MTIIADHKLLDCLLDGNNPFTLRRNLVADQSATEELSDREAWRQSIDHLVSLRSLEDDWDGQRAIAPAADLLESAIELARWLGDHRAAPPHFATAGVNGTVQFEWVDQQHQYFLIEVVAPNEAEIFSMLGDDRESTSGTFRW